MNGDRILRIARKTLREFVENKQTFEMNEEDLPDYFEEEKGVFVTLKKDGELRGCMGLPYPDKKFLEALIRASCSVTRDPRFKNLEKEELDHIDIEVTVLSKPEEIEVSNLQEAEEEIEIGEHGLILEKGGSSGLLLPQVAPDNAFDVEEFLEALSRKAGLSKESWKSPESVIKRFTARIFSESED